MKPRLLLLGDSICGSYHPRVAALLEEHFEVVRPASGTCRSTTYTLELFDDEIAPVQPYAVHWNNGLHDLARPGPPGSPCATTLEQYEANLRPLLARLREVTEGPVTWCRTTPVIDDWHNRQKTFERFESDVEAYNAVADALMGQENVPIHDLHATIVADPDTYLDRKDGVHLTEAGVEAAAQSVAGFVTTNVVLT